MYTGAISEALKKSYDGSSAYSSHERGVQSTKFYSWRLRPEIQRLKLLPFLTANGP